MSQDHQLARGALIKLQTIYLLREDKQHTFHKPVGGATSSREASRAVPREYDDDDK